MAQPNEHAQIRHLVIDTDGEVLADKTVDNPGEEIAQTLEELGDLTRRGGRVLGKLGRLAKMFESTVGPLNRPFPDASEKKPDEFKGRK
jgi:hypothetical protein